MNPKTLKDIEKIRVERKIKSMDCKHNWIYKEAVMFSGDLYAIFICTTCSRAKKELMP